MFTAKFFNELQIEKRLKQKHTKTNFTNNIYLVKKKISGKNIDHDKFKNIWFLKNIHPDKVVLEVVAQEFFRLILPRQPKTRMVLYKNDISLISSLSKGIMDFNPFQRMNPSDLKQKIISGEYSGLGEILVLSLVLNEVDLKLSNIGIDNLGRIIKIDGDWCFARLDSWFENENFSITSNDLDRLPFITEYFSYNWLDIIKEEKYQSSSEFIEVDFSVNESFRLDVNNTILKIILLSNEMINAFVKNYIEDEEGSSFITTEICSRRDLLIVAALQNDSFKQYMKTSLSEDTLDTFMKEISVFKTAKKHTLFEDNQHIFQLYQNYELLLNNIVQAVDHSSNAIITNNMNAGPS
jgi:hypothetical protein